MQHKRRNAEEYIGHEYIERAVTMNGDWSFQDSKLQKQVIIKEVYMTLY